MKRDNKIKKSIFFLIGTIILTFIFIGIYNKCSDMTIYIDTRNGSDVVYDFKCINQYGDNSGHTMIDCMNAESHMIYWHTNNRYVKDIEINITSEEVIIEKIWVKKGFDKINLPIGSGNNEYISCDSGVFEDEKIVFEDSEMKKLYIHNLDTRMNGWDLSSGIWLSIIVILLVFLILDRCYFDWKYSEIIENANWLHFLIFFLSIFSLNMLFDVDIISSMKTYNWCDYRLYWEIGESFWESGKFNFGDCSSAFRGYIIPLLYSCAYGVGKIFGNYSFGYAIVSSVLYAIMFVVVLPKFISIYIKQKNYVLETYTVLCLLMFFWYGLFLYPMSDLIAFMFAMNAINYLHNLQQESENRITVFRNAFLLGINLYAAYNIRTIYQFLVIAVILFVSIWGVIKKRKKMYCTIFVVFFAMMVMAIPQAILNQKLLGIVEFRVPAGSIITLQLTQGVTTQRYETYTGNIGGLEGDSYPNYSLVFEDSIGKKLLEKEEIEQFNSVFEYLSFVCKYPISMLAVYVRHLCNGLNACYPELYVNDLWKNRILYIVLNYIVVFTTSYSLTRKKKGIEETDIYKIILLLPVILIIPGAVEQRFFLPFFFLVYLEFVKEIFNKNRVRKEFFNIQFFVRALCIFLVYITIITNAYSQLRYFLLLID